MRYLSLVFLLVTMLSAHAAELPQASNIFNGLTEQPEKKEPLTRESIKEIKDLINTIENKQKRAQLVKALKAMTVITKVKDSRESFFSLTTNTVSQKVQEAADLTLNALIAVMEFPAQLLQGIVNLSSPDIRNQFLTFLMQTIIILGAAILLELGMRYFLNQFQNKLPRKYPWQRALWQSLPLAVFTITSYSLIQFISNPAILKTLAAIVITRLVWLAGLIILSPRQPEHRLLPVSDDIAMSLYGWFLTLGQMVLIGALLTQILAYLQLEPTAIETWTRLYGFLLLIVVVGFINHYRDAVYGWLQPEAQEFNGISRMVIGFLGLLARSWYFFAILFVLAIYLSWAMQAFDYLVYILQNSLFSVALVIGIISLSRYLHHSSQRWFRRLTHKTASKEDPRGLWRNILQSTHSLIPLIQVLLYVLLLISISRIWGADILELINDENLRETIMTVVSVAIILWVTRILWVTFDLVIDYQMKPITVKNRVLEPSILLKTLGPIIRTVGHVILGIISLVLVLGQLQLNILPLIYGFSLIGLAIGFGAQDLAKDLINGVLILLEGNLAVGEYVIIGEHAGVVEGITPRNLFLRHNNGYLQSIPFSKVNNIINKSRDFTVARIAITLDGTTPIEKAYESLEKTAAQMRRHPVFGPMIQTPLKILGVDESFSVGYKVMASIRTDPDPKGDFLYEFYRQWKEIAGKIGAALPASRHQIELIKPELLNS